MRKFFKLLALMLILSSLFLAACSTPPPSVQKDDYLRAQQETQELDKEVKGFENQKKDLQTQVNNKKAELESLKQYEKELGI